MTGAPPEPSLREVTVAGHTGDATTAEAGLSSPDAAIRAAALGALERLGTLTDQRLAAALTDRAAAVRRRAAELAAHHPAIDLLGALADEPEVAEVAAWACGEHESDRAPIVDKLISLAGGHDDPLVRESAVAALGAIGDPRGLPAIIVACADKPAVRRRAVLALAPFEGPDVEQAIERALTDRDWQVRQAAEDLRRTER